MTGSDEDVCYIIIGLHWNNSRRTIKAETSSFEPQKGRQRRLEYVEGKATVGVGGLHIGHLVYRVRSLGIMSGIGEPSGNLVQGIRRHLTVSGPTITVIGPTVPTDFRNGTLEV